MSVEIRLATEEDYEQCVRLLSVLRASTGGEDNSSEKPAEINRVVYNDMIKGDRGLVLVAEEEGSLLGMSSISFNLALRYEQSYCQLEELVVDSSARGKNVGGLLVSAAVEQARQNGCNDFGLYLMPQTEHNRPFYEKYGFAALGTEMRQLLN